MGVLVVKKYLGAAAIALLTLTACGSVEQDAT